MYIVRFGFKLLVEFDFKLLVYKKTSSESPKWIITQEEEKSIFVLSLWSLSLFLRFYVSLFLRDLYLFFQFSKTTTLEDVDNFSEPRKSLCLCVHVYLRMCVIGDNNWYQNFGFVSNFYKSARNWFLIAPPYLSPQDKALTANFKANLTYIRLHAPPKNWCVRSTCIHMPYVPLEVDIGWASLIHMRLIKPSHLTSCRAFILG